MSSPIVLLALCAAVVTRPCCGAYSVRLNDNGINGASGNCPADRLVAYQVIEHTYWTREQFPKHYPDWRPTAQWTKSIGRSHDGASNLFRLGKPASPALRAFVETGRSDALEQRADGADGGGSVLDEFQMPAIVTGAGRSEGRVFVDSNHTLVSLVTRMVPSPDWFVGVDSFQLCVGGSWIDSVTVDLDPLDAGTDNGFTFTAPNWPTEPQGVVFRMTTHYPAHPAGSFYYPQNQRLPPLATLQFIKHKEFELNEVFQFTEDNHKYDTLSTGAAGNHLDINNNKLSADIEQERQHEMAAAIPIRLTEKDRIHAKLLARINQSSNLTTDSIEVKSMLSHDRPRKATMDHNKHLEVKSSRTHQNADCHVSNWSTWSDCSQTCGIGETRRRRKVIRHARDGGRACPPLQQAKWCGSDRDCGTQANDLK